jgi:hypothetical protein
VEDSEALMSVQEIMVLQQGMAPSLPEIRFSLLFTTASSESSTVFSCYALQQYHITF